MIVVLLGFFGFVNFGRSSEIKCDQGCCDQKVANDEDQHEIKAVCRQCILRFENRGEECDDNADREDRAEHMKKIPSNGRKLFFFENEIAKRDGDADKKAHKT